MKHIILIGCSFDVNLFPLTSDKRCCDFREIISVFHWMFLLIKNNQSKMYSSYEHKYTSECTNFGRQSKRFIFGEMYNYLAYILNVN